MNYARKKEVEIYVRCMLGEPCTPAKINDSEFQFAMDEAFNRIEAFRLIYEEGTELKDTALEPEIYHSLLKDGTLAFAQLYINSRPSHSAYSSFGATNAQVMVDNFETKVNDRFRNIYERGDLNYDYDDDDGDEWKR